MAKDYQIHFTPESQKTQGNVIQCLKPPQLIKFEAMANVRKHLPAPCI